ncbi:MAG: hypothetical protein AAGC68_07580 [Verrucomicrobiota bacterium]
MRRFLLNRVPRFVLVLLGLALFGLARAPLENPIRDRLVEANLLLPPPARSAMEQMGQSALMGTLGGLRSLVSSYLVLKAFDHFTLKEWEELKATYGVITALEPRDENHWRDVVWHIGINASANMQIDESIPAFERQRRFNEYTLEAIDLAEKGLEQNPDSAVIRLQLGEVYREKLDDYCETARIYGEMMDLPEAPGYAKRFYGYFLAQCPGKEQEAYDQLRPLYLEEKRQGKVLTPSLIAWLKDLEKHLDISPRERIPEPYPIVPGAPGRNAR